MTTSQIIACAISWTAAIVAVTALIRTRHAANDARAERRTFTTPQGGVLTFDRRMTDAEVQAFKEMWQRMYKPGAPHPVVPLLVDGAVCAAYRPPTAAEDSGLCARCGMSDYKHEEQPRV